MHPQPAISNWIRHAHMYVRQSVTDMMLILPAVSMVDQAAAKHGLLSMVLRIVGAGDKSLCCGAGVAKHACICVPIACLCLLTQRSGIQHLRYRCGGCDQSIGELHLFSRQVQCEVIPNSCIAPAPVIHVTIAYANTLRCTETPLRAPPQSQLDDSCSCRMCVISA